MDEMNAAVENKLFTLAIEGILAELKRAKEQEVKASDSPIIDGLIERLERYVAAS